jgi:hypothetical protein
MKRSLFRGSIAALALCAAFASLGSSALAGTYGAIAGTVTDAKTGAPVAGVALRVSSPSQTANVTTDSHGHYLVFSLLPDDYTLSAQKEGYQSLSVRGQSVEADQTQRYDLELTPITPAAQ